jgi:hypothetical protein
VAVVEPEERSVKSWWGYAEPVADVEVTLVS